MNWPGQDRWERVWQAAGASGNPVVWHKPLARAYGEPQRYYHNLQHLAECLAEFAVPKIALT